jgi:hypothetical protein
VSNEPSDDTPSNRRSVRSTVTDEASNHTPLHRRSARNKMTNEPPHPSNDTPPNRRGETEVATPAPSPSQRSQPPRQVRETVGDHANELHPTERAPSQDEIRRIAKKVFKGRPYTTLYMPQTLKEKIDEKQTYLEEFVWTDDKKVIAGNVLILSRDNHIMGIKVDPAETTFVHQLTEGFERLRRTWAHKRRATAVDPESRDDAIGHEFGDDAIEHELGDDAIEHERQRLLKRRREEVLTNSLPAPLPSDHRHHDFEAMRKLYGKSRCGVLHFAYWIPLGQVHPCLSADTCPPSYRHSAVASFLKSTWGFQQKATDILRVIAPKVASRYKAAVDKIRNWDPGFHLFGNTSYFGMAVVHNLQVSRTLAMTRRIPLLTRPRTTCPPTNCAVSSSAPSYSPTNCAYSSSVNSSSHEFRRLVLPRIAPTRRPTNSAVSCSHEFRHLIQVGLHTDGGDDKHGFIVMTPFGEYEGGHLVIGDPDQGYWTLDYRPGSYFIFRSSCMEHAITPFKGDRTAVVLFTKDNALRYVETDNTAPDPYLEDAGLETDPDEV